MFAWIDNPHAAYVVAAYAVAAIALIGIGVASVWRYRRLSAAVRALPLSRKGDVS